MLIALFKSKKCNVLTCASTGIAADLLFEGTTAHSRFSIPLYYRKGDRLPFLTPQKQDILRTADVIILDEISAFHRDNFDFVDLICREADPDNNNLPFGGKVIHEFIT